MYYAAYAILHMIGSRKREGVIDKISPESMSGYVFNTL